MKKKQFMMWVAFSTIFVAVTKIYFDYNFGTQTFSLQPVKG